MVVRRCRGGDATLGVSQWECVSGEGVRPRWASSETACDGPCDGESSVSTWKSSGSGGGDGVLLEEWRSAAGQGEPEGERVRPRGGGWVPPASGVTRRRRGGGDGEGDGVHSPWGRRRATALTRRGAPAVGGAGPVVAGRGRTAVGREESTRRRWAGVVAVPFLCRAAEMLRRPRLGRGRISTTKSSSSRSAPMRAPVGEAATAGAWSRESGVRSRATVVAEVSSADVPSSAPAPAAAGGAAGPASAGGRGIPAGGGGAVGIVEGALVAAWEDKGDWSSGGRGRAYASSIGTLEDTR